jgi:multicomponent Na+:H+ antiporter subunit A
MHLSPLPSSISPMLILSAITIAGGIAMYARRRVLERLYQKLKSPLDVESAYERMISALPRAANELTRVIQSGHLRYYVATIVGVAMVLIAYTFFVFSGQGLPPDLLERLTDIRFHEIVIAGVILTGLVLVIRANSLLVIVVSLGAIGYGVALIFMLFGAPDLAMTQFAIETLSVILFVLVLYRLPPAARLSTRRARIRDSILALITGGVVATLVLVITDQPLVSDLKDFFAESSYTLAHGQNIVNVILVDFRGFDTMGEITVLGIAAVGIFSLLKLRLGVKKTDEVDEEELEDS